MKTGITRQFIADLRTVIDEKNDARAKQIICDLHPADIAEIYDELNIDEASYLFLLLDPEMGADVVSELEEDDRERFLKALPGDVIAKQFIESMDSDDAADAIADLTDEKRAEVLQNLTDVEQAGDIVDLLHYDEDTAGGLMAKELVSVRSQWNVETCIREMRKQAEGVGEVYYVYVVDDDEVLQGTLSLKRLLLSNDDVLVATIMNSDIITVPTTMESEEVAMVMEKYNLVALPVVDSIHRLVGRITIDDVVDVIREEAEKDYQMASGISEDVEASDSVYLLTRARLPWLLIGLLGGILGALVISNYEHDLSVIPAMAFFIPLIAAMGGNVGVQSSAIVVQGLAAKTLYIESTGKKILKELSVAFLNGAVCSIIIFAYNFFVSDSFELTLTVSTALFIVILIASVFGTFVPLALNRFKIDPALATGPFITTVNDILGLFIYLSIGRFMFDAI